MTDTYTRDMYCIPADDYGERDAIVDSYQPHCVGSSLALLCISQDVGGAAFPRLERILSLSPLG